MKPRERREAGERNLFRSRLDQTIDSRQLVTLVRETDWALLERIFGEAIPMIPFSRRCPPG